MSDTKDRSILGKVFIGAPMAIGVGITINDIIKKPTQFKNPIASSTAANNLVDALVNNFTDPGRAANKWRYSIDAAVTSANLPPQMVTESWKKALSYSGMSEQSIGQIIDKIQGTTTEQVINEISQSIATGKQSVYMQRAASRFAQDTSILISATKAGRPATFSQFEMAHSEFAKLSSIGNRGISPTALRDPFLIEQLYGIQSELGAGMQINIAARSDIPGSELSVRYTGGKLPAPLELKIPRVLPEDPNIVVRGATQQSKYIAGQFTILEGNKIKSTLNYEQWMLLRAREDLIPKLLHDRQLTSSSMRREVSKFHGRMAESLEWVESLPAGTHQGLDQYLKLRSNIRHLYGVGGAQLDELAYARLLETGYLETAEGIRESIFPGASATQISKNVVYMTDPREMYLFPEAMSFGRRPLQPIRREFAPTSQAIEYMQKDYLNREFSWAKMKAGVEAPMARAMYVSETEAARLAESGIGTQGGGLISNILSPQRRIRELMTYNISTKEVGEISKFLTPGATSWEINQVLEEGAILGREPSGSIVQAGKNLKVLTATMFEDEGMGQFIKLVAEREIGDLQWSKVYGGGKGMFAEVPQERLVYEARKFGATHLGEINAIISMGELKKNRGLLWNQVFTSLWNYSKQNMNSGKQLGALASNFANDPTKMINKIRTLATRGDIMNEDKVLSATMRLARSAKLTPEQMGGVFGAIPDIFMSAKSAGGIMQEWGQKGWGGPITLAEAEYLNKRVSQGVTQLMFGGLVGPGSGKTGTIEPRMFELLQSEEFGLLGKEIQADISARMLSEYGYRLGEQDILARSIKSMISPSSIAGGISPTTALADIGKYMESGFNLNIPSVGAIEVPGQSVLSQMAAFKTASGQEITSDLAKMYQGLIATASEFESGNIGRQALTEQLNQTISEATKSYFATITGEGGLLRNRLPGSVFLTGVPNAFQYALADKYTVGITKSYALKMFEGMQGIYNPEQIQAMMKTLGEGGIVPGMMARHPAIGPYSVTPVKYKLVPGEGPYAVFNEMERQALITPGSKILSEQGAIEALQGNVNRQLAYKQAGTAIAEGIRFSPLVGMAGDVDADIYAAWFAGPQLTEKLGQYIGTPEYEEYMLRGQLLKGKAKKGNVLTLRQMAAEDALKIGIPQTRLGSLSVQLQQARASVLQGTLGKTEKTQALGLLEFLEQTPISGKHLAPGQAPRMIDLFADLQNALRKGDPGLMRSTITNLFDGDTLAGYKGTLLDQGVTVAYMDENNKLAQKFVRGFELNKTTTNIANEMATFKKSMSGEFSAARLHEALMGRIPSFSPSQAKSVIQNMEETFLKDFFLAPKQAGTMANLAKGAQSMVNRLGAAGRSMIPLSKPLAIGLGASIAIGAMLSAPPISLDAEMKQPPSPNLDSGTGGQYINGNNLTRGSINGRPGTPDSIPSGKHYVARGGGARRGYSVNISGESSNSINYTDMSAKVSRFFGKNTYTNTHVQDDRRSLTPQRVSDILKGR